mgnify:CR=1 FL=1
MTVYADNAATTRMSRTALDAITYRKRVILMHRNSEQ